MSSLELAALDVRYGGVHAVRDLSFEVAPGEMVGLIGANGAGKSSTLRAINGVLHPRRGKIRFQGKDITHASPHSIVKSGIAQSPEGRRLFPRMTVVENLEMGAFQRTDKPEIREDMERVFELFPRLQERRNQKAGTMSGGEQQMCAIGRALMSNPKLLLLDEPSAGLAPVVVQQVFELVKRIRSRGLTVLIVEQNVQQVLRVVDRAYLIEAGTIRASGTSAEMLASDTVKEAYLGV